jgi:hypothetical protein
LELKKQGILGVPQIEYKCSDFIYCNVERLIFLRVNLAAAHSSFPRIP